MSSSPLNRQYKGNDLPNYKVINSKKIESLFQTGNQFIAFPGANANKATQGVGDVEPKTGASPNDFYSDDISDISIGEIVRYTNEIPSMRLNFADFAYLRDVGVFPNNRLMVARRFNSGVSSDLTPVKQNPMATLISWVPDGEDFISVQYGEIWDEAAGSFTDILNDIGGEMKASQEQGSKLGDDAAGGFGFLPLPGFMEGIQYEVMKKLGITEAGVGNSPLGNPNLIRKAKQRALVAKNAAGSGLMCQFSVKMVVEYEQKYINGVDPSLVYLDIIQNALTFGTSDAFFQFNSKFQTKTSQFIQNLISGDIKQIAQALAQFVDSLLTTIGEIGGKIINLLINPPTNDETPSVDSILSSVQKAFASTIGHVISKYKIKLLGVSNALTGSPSGPWHITIGNPKKPLFCSGDMIVDDVTLNLGKNLAFNDLPSSIKLEFTLKNARPLGAQEIFTRFNTGRGRSYARFQKSYGEASFGFTSSVVDTGSAPITGTNSTYKTFTSNTRVTDETKPDSFLEVGSSTYWGSNSSTETKPVSITNVEVNQDYDIQPSLKSVSTEPNSVITPLLANNQQVVNTNSAINQTTTNPEPTATATTPVNNPPFDNFGQGYIDGVWEKNKILNSGKFSQEGITSNFSVTTSNFKGVYVAKWDESDGTTDDLSYLDYDIALSTAKANAESSFGEMLQMKGKTRI